MNVYCKNQSTVYINSIACLMKTTRYFDNTRHTLMTPAAALDRELIHEVWIRHVIEHPEREEVQADGRIRRWAKIRAASDRYLRVVLLSDGETVHNAFFDRRFRL